MLLDNGNPGFHNRLRCTFRQCHSHALAEQPQPAYKLIARQNRGGGHREIAFRFMALDQLDFSAALHQGSLDDRLVAKLVGNRFRRSGHFRQQIFDDARVPPAQQVVDVAHFGLQPVIGGVANGQDFPFCGRANFLGQLANALVAGDLLAIADPQLVHLHGRGGIQINAGHHQGPKKITLTGFVHSDPGGQHFRIENVLVAQPRFTEQDRLQIKLNKIGRALPLDHQLARLVAGEADFFGAVLRAEVRVRHIAEHVAALFQVRLQLGSLVSRKLARVRCALGHAPTIP